MLKAPDGAEAAIDKGRGGRTQPAAVAGGDGEAHRPVGEQRRSDRLRHGRIGEPPAGRRIVEGEAEPGIAASGDRRRAADGGGDGGGNAVRAVMAAEQRHDGGTGLGDGDDRRLRPLVGEERSQCPDQDPGGADADDRRAGGEQGAKMARRLGKSLVAAVRPPAQAMDPALRQDRLQAAGQRQPAGRQRDEGRAGRQRLRARRLRAPDARRGGVSLGIGAADQNHREIWGGVEPGRVERQDLLFGHAGALDVAGDRSEPEPGEHPADLGQVPADLHDRRGVREREPGFELVLGQRRRQHAQHLVARGEADAGGGGHGAQRRDPRHHLRRVARGRAARRGT